MASSVRELLYGIGKQMGKRPEDMQPFIQKFEDNWIESVDQIKSLTDDQWNELKLPMGLVNKIKDSFNAGQPVQQMVKHDSNKEEEKKQPQIEWQQVSREDLIKEEVQETCLDALDKLKSVDLKDNFGQHKDTVKTLLTITQNLLAKPLDPSVRRMNKTNKAVQTKIMKYPNAVRFMKLIGFDFESNVDQIELKDYRKEVFQGAIEAINLHILSLGGQIDNQEPKFDPYKAQLSSTTNVKIPIQKEQDLDKYDPTAVQQEIQKIKEQREQMLREKVAVDRDIKVFNIVHTGQNLKSYLMELDQQEAQRLAKLNLNEEKMDEAIENTMVLKFLADNQQNMKFKNKRQQELEKLAKQPVHTTSLVRIRFPDDYCIQGTFAALERLDDVYKFIKQNLVDQQRDFQLYVAPPKKILTELGQTLKQARMVPSAMIYFAWKDLPQTLANDGPFLDIAKLKNHIIAF